MNNNKPMIEAYNNPIDHITRLVTHANDNKFGIIRQRRRYIAAMQRLKHRHAFERREIARYRLKQLAHHMHKLETNVAPVTYEDMISSEIGRILNSMIKYFISGR